MLKRRATQINPKKYYVKVESFTKSNFLKQICALVAPL